MKELKSGCDLNHCFLCRLCQEAWVPAIGAHRKTYLLRKGAVLFREGDPVTGIFFVYQGLMKVHKQWDDEKELIVRFAKSGDVVGHRGLGTELVYPVTATALEITRVCYINLSFFEATLQVNQQFLYKLMMFYARELQESEKNMRNLAHMPVKGRIATALLMLKDKFSVDGNEDLGISLTRQDLASYAGTTYETVFRILNELSAEGIIAFSGKEILIRQKEKLSELRGT
jgi:CRP-like cAMP-binding protein